MNTKTLAIAIALIAGTVIASPAHAENIATLQTVQVRPASDQLAQQAHERSSVIATLAALQVRPSAEQIADRDGVSTALPITTLAAVQVRPSLEQKVALAAELQAEQYGTAIAAAATSLARDVIVSLPALQVRPSTAQVQALAVDTAMVLVRP